MKNIKHLFCLMLVASLVSVFTNTYAQDGDVPDEGYSFCISDWDCNTITANTTEPQPVILYTPYVVAILNDNGVISYRKEQATSYTSYQGKVNNKTNKVILNKPHILLLQKTVSIG